MRWLTRLRAFVDQGERRFWLGAMVDDLFLSTAVFQYGASSLNEGDEVPEAE